MDGKEEEDALEVVLKDGRVQEVPAAGIVLLGRQRLDLRTKCYKYFEDSDPNICILVGSP